MALVKSRSSKPAKPCDGVEEGKIVLCKIRGYCHWPAVVTGIENNLISIEFFGDKTTQKTSLTNLYSFEDSHDIILNNLRTKKTLLYSKAVCEAECVSRVPPEKSLLNQI